MAREAINTASLKRFGYAQRCLWALLMTASVCRAAGAGSADVRPTFEHCASASAESPGTVEFTVLPSGTRRPPQLTTRIASVAQVPIEAGTRKPWTCWDKAWGMPDPNSRSVSLTMGALISSRAPGLDASVRDAALEVLQETQPIARARPPGSPRPDLPHCTFSYLKESSSAVTVSMVFLRSGGHNTLSNWFVRMTDPIGLDERESFHMFARCLAGALGSGPLLQPVEWANGEIVARSRP